MNVAVSIEVPGPPILSELEIERISVAVLLDRGQNGNAEVSVVLTDDDAIRALNRAYRQRDTATDVLAFAMREGPMVFDNTPLGDVVISEPTAKSQAAELGITPAARCAELLIHGLLHLLGYDHQTDEDDRKMRELTARLLREHGP